MDKKRKWNLEEHLNWLEKQPPSIIGQTCQMLSALKIPMNPKEGFLYLLSIVADMERSGNLKLKEEEWSDLRTDALYKYLPKILRERKWVDSIEDYLTKKAKNALITEARKRTKQVPLCIADKDGKKVENPEVEAYVSKTKQFERIEDYVFVNELINKAGLTDREERVFRHKILQSLTDEAIVKEMGLTGGKVSRETVNKDFAKAMEKFMKLNMEDK